MMMNSKNYCRMHINLVPSFSSTMNSFLDLF